MLGPVASNFTRETFEAAVERAREYIFAGDAFQIVPSQRFSAPMSLDPFAVYRGLRTVNPSPYMFFLETGEVTLVGSSPEMLVQVRGRRGGDAPDRGHPSARGRPSRRTSAWPRSCWPTPRSGPSTSCSWTSAATTWAGSPRSARVHVTELMDVRRYSHVMHIVSSVVGALAAGRRALGRAAGDLPGGHPVRARPRCGRWRSSTSWSRPGAGRTAGAVGYLGWDGNLDTCITIRTVVCQDGMAHVQAGAGIVADSVPAAEYEETQNKAAALFRAIEVAAAESDW